MFWDEVLTFVVPVLLVLAAVRWAERRRPADGEDDLDGPRGNVDDGSHPTKPTRSD